MVDNFNIVMEEVTEIQEHIKTFDELVELAMFWYDNIDASRACYLEEALPGSFVVKRVGKAKQQKSHFEDHYPGYTPSKPSMRKRNLRGSNGVAAVTVPITAVAWRQTISKFNESINHLTEDRHIDGF